MVHWSFVNITAITHVLRLREQIDLLLRTPFHLHWHIPLEEVDKDGHLVVKVLLLHELMKLYILRFGQRLLATTLDANDLVSGQ